jgi:hypothetical protein
MSTELVFRSGAAFFGLLAAVCPRYDVAKPSIGRRRRGGKLRPFNGFHSDYPLNLSSFWPEYCSAPETLYIRPSLVLASESLSSRAVCPFRLPRLSCVVGCSSKNSASTSSIRKAIARSLASENPEQRSSVPDLGVIAASSGYSNHAIDKLRDPEPPIARRSELRCSRGDRMPTFWGITVSPERTERKRLCTQVEEL